MNRRLVVTLASAITLQSVLVGAAVAPRLSARLTGEEIALRVAPLDPIDPFRGAYVALTYPDLQQGTSESAGGGLGSLEDGEEGDVFVSLRRSPSSEGELWVADEVSRDRPDDGLYLACDDRDWQIRCGIESWFLPQDEALALEQEVADGKAVARVKVDSRGNAALVAVDVMPERQVP